MSSSSTDFPGSTSTGSTGTSNDRSSTGLGSTGLGSSSTGTGSTGTGAAPGLAKTAREYGEKITEAAGHARDYVSDKMTVVGDKVKDLQNADLAEIAENAKDYARKNPGQAILISAAAGLLVGLILRGRRN